MSLANPVKVASFIRNSIKALILGARIFMVLTVNRGGGTSVGGGLPYFGKTFTAMISLGSPVVFGNSLQIPALSLMIPECV